MIFELKPKSIGITKEQVWSAWKRIKQGGKGVGVDNVTIEMIEENPRKYVYPVWNRMASGSYFPPAVRSGVYRSRTGDLCIANAALWPTELIPQENL